MIKLILKINGYRGLCKLYEVSDMTCHIYDMSYVAVQIVSYLRYDIIFMISYAAYDTGI